MEYQETGRFGRITKSLRKNGFGDSLKDIVHDSTKFSSLKKHEQASYVETVMERMVATIGQEDAEAVMYSCGELCCGKSWRSFARKIWDSAGGSVADFVDKLNREEEKYNTYIEFDAERSILEVFRKKCICGLVNRGKPFERNKTFCSCSTGHMAAFFGALFNVDKISLMSSIMSGDQKCGWEIRISSPCV